MHFSGYFSGRPLIDHDEVSLETRAFTNENTETKADAAAAGENESDTEINWPADFFFGLPCPKFQYPIIIPPKSRNQLVLFCVKVNSVLQKKIFSN